MTETIKATPSENKVTAVEVDRVLAVGSLLLAVLTPEEIETFRLVMQGQRFGQNGKTKIGNASGS
jgi:hypothetical protein